MNDKLLTNSAQRVDNLINRLNLSKLKFAQIIGITPGTIYNIVDNRSNPGIHFINAVNRAYPNINTNWILTGDGNMFNNPDLPPDAGAAPPPTQARFIQTDPALEILKMEITKKDQMIHWLQNQVEALIRNGAAMGKFNPLEMSELADLGEQFGGRMAA